jgi:HAMP domain-containing protein
MESRGIYMSADWHAAEPFAKNLIPQLDELQDVARAWKADAIASQTSNTEDLAERIDQFVRFRMELVRLGREDSTAAARAFGDNDANRTVRTALNNSLRVVSRTYEQEIGRARSQVEDDDHNLLAILVTVAGLGALGLCGGLIFVKTGLLKPVLRMRDSMLRLAQGDLDIKVDGRPRAAEIAEMAQALEVFHATLTERHKLNREAQLLADLNEWLQSCNSLGELYQMVAEFLGRLLPACGGSLYIYANSRDVLESAKAWNGGTMMPAMHPGACGADGPIPMARTKSASCVRMPLLRRQANIAAFPFWRTATDDSEVAPSRAVAMQRALAARFYVPAETPDHPAPSLVEAS